MMDFFKPVDTKEIDSYINTVFYQGLSSQGEGIDLRIEMHNILYGNGQTSPKGHWVVLRSYDMASPSRYFNKSTKEGIGGPAFNYKDTILRSRRVPKALGVDPMKAGNALDDAYIYFFEYDVKIKRGDHIIELYWNDHTNKPIVDPSIMVDRYRVVSVHPYRLENGNVQYHSANAEIDETSN